MSTQSTVSQNTTASEVFLELPPAVSIQPDANGKFATPADGAKFMASLGIPQVPLSAPSDTHFSNPGKNPAINGKKWQEKATTNAAQIDRWAKTHPGCNFGSVAKAQMDGFYVLETDSPDLAQKYAREIGSQLQSGLVIESSAPGRNHRWYRHSSISLAELRNIGQEETRGFSLRCDNEQAVSPGSIHANGKQYRLIYSSGLAPTAQPVEELRWLNAQKPHSAPRVNEPTGSRTLIPPGGHHNALLKELGSLIYRGYSKETATQALLLWAGEWLESPGHGEPLEDHIRKMVDSSDDWKRGTPNVQSESQNPFAESGTSPTESIEAPATEPATLNLRCAGSIKPRQIRWLWPGRLPFGKITLFAGNPDNGKSLASTSVAAICSTGGVFPETALACPSSDVLMLIGEDDPDDTAVPRLLAAGADMKRIHFPEASRPDTTESREIRLDWDIPALEATLTANPNIRLIIIDPISNYLGDVNMMSEQDVRSVLIPLKRMAAKFSVAVIIVMHLNKKSDLDAINRVGGAMAFIGVARCSWLFARNVQDETQGEDVSKPTEKNPDTFSMRRIKNNLVSSSRAGLSYSVAVRPIEIEGEQIMTPYVVWGKVIEGSADDALVSVKRQQHSATAITPHQGAGRPKDARSVAVRWLESALQDGQPHLSKELIKDAKDAEGIAERTLRRAYDDLGGKSVKRGDRYCWQISPMNETAAKDDLMPPPQPSGLISVEGAF